MNHSQATGVAEALAKTMVVEPASRADLDRLDARLEGRIAALRTDLRFEFAKIRGEMQAGFAAVKFEPLRWILPIVLAQLAMTIGLPVRLQPRSCPSRGPERTVLAHAGAQGHDRRDHFHPALSMICSARALFAA